jgi:hypothetical protein
MISVIEEAHSSVVADHKEKRMNPKRLARQAAKEAKQKGVSVFAREAIKLEYERRKQERKQAVKEQKEEEARQKRELKVLKRKEKHRGR